MRTWRKSEVGSLDMLSIDYLPTTSEAVIQVSAPFDWWPILRTLLDQQTDEVTYVSSTELRCPWWHFLAVTEELGELLRYHGVEPHFSVIAERLLETAAIQRKAFESADGAHEVSEEDLEVRLRSQGFDRALTQEQTRNVLHLIRYPAAASFSVPGAGKTTEALAYYFFRRNQNSRLLVVAPKNAFAAWEEQLLLCAPKADLKVVRLVGDRADHVVTDQPDVLLVTYQKLTREVPQVARYLQRHESFMFLDESHHIKRWPPGPTARSVLALSHLPVAKLILSGTPLPNSTADLLSQFKFLYPNLPVSEESIVDAIRRIYVRTTKAELGLRPPNHRIISIILPARLRELYELLKTEEARQLRAGLGARDRNVLRRVGQSSMRMLQFVTNPSLLAKSDQQLPRSFAAILLASDSPKLEYACRRARELAAQGKKTVIWSTFVENVETIALRLRDLGADYLHGGVDVGGEDTDSDTREAKIRRFHDDPEAYVLVANPAACAEGISLHTVCHNAIYVDRNYNAAQFLQSQDRIHRLGLKPDTVTEVEILVVSDTVDEHVTRRLETKVRRMGAVLADRSLHVEPEVTDLDQDGFNEEDAKDYLEFLASS
jgi:SNF2 family DNA or RNA helicase